MRIDAGNLHFKMLDEYIRYTEDYEITIDNCIGQRRIANSSHGKKIIINGTPGNALGTYMDGSIVEVFGNAQDAVGDTMNSGKIIIHGNAGDACGYAARGGTIYVKNNAGYRAGIYMKKYKTENPVIIIGNEAGSFLGECQDGGIISVLGLKTSRKIPVGRCCGTGMSGGKIFLRCDEPPADLPKQIVATQATNDDLKELVPYIKEYCKIFGTDFDAIMSKKFVLLMPNSKELHHSMYMSNLNIE